MSRHKRICRRSRVLRARYVQFVGQLFHLVVRHRDGSGIEGIGLDQICAGCQILRVNLLDDLWLGEREQIVVPLQIVGPVLKPFAAVVYFPQFVTLDHRPHRPVDDDDSFAQEIL